MEKLKCNKCGKLIDVTNEMLIFCPYCNKKLDNSFIEWKKKSESNSFEEYKRKYCINESDFVTQKPVTHIQNQVVNTKKSRSNGIGLAGFIVSLIPCFFIIYPPSLILPGLIFYIVSFLLSLTGLIIAIVSKKNAGFSVAGLVISTVFIAIIILMLYGYFSFFNIHSKI